ncbi:hypothetical protein SKAU_G00148800 [Synaphobranchus kaupii]|uniref:Uncharacterized protein n=1 Tax=Synaphobranchus kaupii TaxID=118154 RepID=A0A9Q1J405_SYNKA|nr:hypothetical protein SKAU_G00148800 [Synaphobranchus kaupii]
MEHCPLLPRFGVEGNISEPENASVRNRESSGVRKASFPPAERSLASGIIKAAMSAKAPRSTEPICSSLKYARARQTAPSSLRYESIAFQEESKRSNGPSAPEHAGIWEDHNRRRKITP